MERKADRHDDQVEAAWRLALTLRLGDAAGAERVVLAALQAQPDFAAIPADRVDRLIVLRARASLSEKASRSATKLPQDRPQRPTIHERLESARVKHRSMRLGSDPAAPAKAHDEAPAIPQPESGARPPAVRRLLAALALLDEQPREAWVFVRVFRRNLRWSSRAMDCSTAAVARHLSQADDGLRSGLGDTSLSDASEALLGWLSETDHAALRRLRSQVRSRKRRRRTARMMKLAVGVALILAVVGAVVALIIQASGASPP